MSEPMSEERLARLRVKTTTPQLLIDNSVLDECLTEIERLRAELASFAGLLEMAASYVGGSGFKGSRDVSNELRDTAERLRSAQ